MSKSNKFSPEVREHAVAMVQEHRGEYDNALSGTIDGRYVAGVIHRRGLWKTKQAVELATLEWVAWFNHHRLMQPLG